MTIVGWTKDKKGNEMKKELELLKQENERLKAEITRLSDPFLHAPDWAEWFAVDENGYGYFYYEEPRFPFLEHEWLNPGFSSRYCCCGYYPKLAANWKNTKVRRTRKPDSGSLPTI